MLKCSPSLFFFSHVWYFTDMAYMKILYPPINISWDYFNYSVISFVCEMISALKSSIVLQETTIDKCSIASCTNNIINPNCFMSPVLISIWRYQEMVLAFWPQLLNQASYMLHSYPRLSSKMNKCLPICTRCIKLKSTEPS